MIAPIKTAAATLYNPALTPAAPDPPSGPPVAEGPGDKVVVVLVLFEPPTEGLVWVVLVMRPSILTLTGDLCLMYS
jgi:hypothetical protein